MTYEDILKDLIDIQTDITLHDLSMAEGNYLIIEDRAAEKLELLIERLQKEIGEQEKKQEGI